MQEQRIYTLGLMLEHVYEDSLSYWRSKYAASITLDDLLGTAVNNVDCAVSFGPRGAATITCTVVARRRQQTEAYFFRAQRQGPNDWVIVGSSFGLD